MDGGRFCAGRAVRRHVPRAGKEPEEPGRAAKLARPKVHVGFRLAADVVEGIKASGKGFNARVEQILRDALAQGKL